MSQSEPNLPEPWPDILAAYVDGELECGDRAAVERWLAAHPRAREELRAQWKLSPENWRLWQKAEPPLPDDEAWAAAQETIAEAALTGAAKTDPALPRTERRDGRRRFAPFLAGSLAVAASVLLALGLVGRWLPRPADDGRNGEVVVAPEASADDPLAGIETLVLARDEDVVIDRVAGDAAGSLPVGQLPFTGPIVLATAEEVALEGAEDHPGWPEGGLRLTGGPGDAPMIFAANPR
jgi:anti-sigma factor RsiW